MRPFGVLVGVTIALFIGDGRADLSMIMNVSDQFYCPILSDRVPATEFLPSLACEIIYMARSGKSNEAKSEGRIIMCKCVEV